VWRNIHRSNIIRKSHDQIDSFDFRTNRDISFGLALKIRGDNGKLVKVTIYYKLLIRFASRPVQGFFFEQNLLGLRSPKLRIQAPRTASVLYSEDFVWPTLLEIEKCSRNVLPKNPKLFDLEEGLFVKEGRIWIPTEELRVRIMVISHAGLSGHRGIQATLDSIRQHFIWEDMMEDVEFALPLSYLD
jgi:hypothetical protein